MLGHSQSLVLSYMEFAKNKVIGEKLHNTEIAEQSQSLSGWTLLWRQTQRSPMHLWSGLCTGDITWALGASPRQHQLVQFLLSWKDGSSLWSWEGQVAELELWQTWRMSCKCVSTPELTMMTQHVDLTSHLNSESLEQAWRVSVSSLSGKWRIPLCSPTSALVAMGGAQNRLSNLEAAA